MGSKFEFEVPFYVERGADEIELLVRGNVSAYRRAVTNRLPENCSPEEGGDPEIIEIVTLVGVQLKPWNGELSDAEVKDAEEKLRLAAADSEPDEPDEPDDDYDDRE